MVLDLALSYPGWARGSAPEKTSTNCQHQGTAQDLGEPLLSTWTSEGAKTALQGLMSYPWLQEEAPRDHKGCARSN